MEKKEFAVLGLGRFGVSLAESLAEAGCEVMVADKKSDMVEEVVDYVVHAEIGDVTNKEFLQSLGLSNYDGVIVGIGDDLAAGVMTTILAKEAGAKFIIAKAGSELQARILKKVGADSIVFPELETGRRIANQLVHGNYFDAVNLSATHSIMDIYCPEEWSDKSLKDLNLRAKYKVSVIAVKREENLYVNPEADHKLNAGDILVVLGDNNQLDKIYKMSISDNSN